MKRILITGANRGIGLELARLCAAGGDWVFAGCRSLSAATDLEKLAMQYPERVSILQLEITDKESIERCIKQVANEVDALDLLINNAAIYCAGETIRTFDSEQATRQWMVNTVGQMMVIHYFLDLLKKGISPKIINVTSEAGSISTMEKFRGYYYYGSKAAMNMFSRCLAWDPEMTGITTIALHPGWVRTDMGGPDADLPVNQSAAGILKVAAVLKPQDNGKFFTWEGIEYPW